MPDRTGKSRHRFRCFSVLFIGYLSSLSQMHLCYFFFNANLTGAYSWDHRYISFWDLVIHLKSFLHDSRSRHLLIDGIYLFLFCHHQAWLLTSPIYGLLHANILSWKYHLGRSVLVSSPHSCSRAVWTLISTTLWIYIARSKIYRQLKNENFLKRVYRSDLRLVLMKKKFSCLQRHASWSTRTNSVACLRSSQRTESGQRDNLVEYLNIKTFETSASFPLYAQRVGYT